MWPLFRGFFTKIYWLKTPIPKSKAIQSFRNVEICQKSIPKLELFRMKIPIVFLFFWALGISWYYREECRSGETSRYSFLQSNFVFFHMIHSTTFLLFWNNKKKVSFISFIVPQESVHYFHFGPPETLFPEKQKQKLRKSADIVLNMQWSQNTPEM